MANNAKKGPAGKKPGKNNSGDKNPVANGASEKKATSRSSKRAGKQPRRADIVADSKIVLNPEVPVKIVGPAVPFDFDDKRLEGIDPEVLHQLYSESVQVHEYPDPNTIQVDENGFVVGYGTAPAGKSHVVAAPDEHVAEPGSTLHGLVRKDLPGLKSMRAPRIKKLVSGLPSIEEVGTSVLRIPPDLLEALLTKYGKQRRRDKSRGKSKGQGGNHQPLPGPQLMLQVVTQLLSENGITEVGNEGDLVVGIQNGEFLTASKANFYLDAWAAIAKTAHVLMVVEANAEGLAVIGKAIGYGHYCSKCNSRDQAVGFLIHPRLRLTGEPVSIWEVANVGASPDLRPGFLLPLQDTASGLEFEVEVKHLKSMRGGEQQTSPIRIRQSVEDARAIKARDGKPVLIGGDLNCKLDTTHDLDPMLKDGFVLIEADSTTATHQMGSRLDGVITYHLEKTVDGYQVTSWWSDKRIGRALTDHSYVRMHIKGTGRPATGSGGKG